jgi:hypothetical protein
MLKGIVTIQARDADTGELLWQRTEKNLVPDATRKSLIDLSLGGNNALGKSFIALGTSAVSPTLANNTVANIVAGGRVPAGVTSPTLVDSADPPYLQIQNRFDNTGSDRTFASISLIAESLGNSISPVTKNVYAYLNLSPTVTQGDNEVLDVFYRVQFDPTTSYMSSAFIHDLLYYNANYTNYFNFPGMNYVSFSFQKPNSSYINYTGVYYFGFGSTASHNPVPWTGFDSATWVDNEHKYRYVLNRSSSQDLGLICSSALRGYGFSQTSYAMSPVLPGYSPFQSVFSHSSSSTTPFFTPLQTASGTGSLTLGGTWAGGFPEIYKIKILTTGEIGTSTYRFSRRKTLGFEGNTFVEAVVLNAYFGGGLPPFPNAHGWSEADVDFSKYSSTQVLQYDATGVSVVNLIDGSYTTYGAHNGLNVTNVCQVCSLTNIIYVACRATGLWSINNDTQVITHVSGTPCYGVDYFTGGPVVAVFEGSLRSSTSWGTSLSFDISTIGGVWSDIKFIRAIPDSTDSQLALAVAGSTQKICYYSTSGGPVAGPGYTVTDMRPCNLRWIDATLCDFLLTPKSVYATPLGGQSLSRLAWGSNSFLANAAYPAGQTLRGELAVYKNYYVTSYGLHDANLSDSSTVPNSMALNGGVLNSYNPNYYPPFTNLIYLGEGIWYGGKYLFHLLGDSHPDTWEDYGWDGSSWVLGNTGGKATHSDSQALIDGITVTFTGGTGTPDFYGGDYYTQGVMSGLWKDPFTTLSYVDSVYARPIVEGVPISWTIPGGSGSLTHVLDEAPTGLTPDISWERVETYDRAYTMSVKLNGTPVNTIYIAGEAPGPSEVTVDAVNGTLTFNSADRGKVVTGYYTLIQLPEV